MPIWFENLLFFKFSGWGNIYIDPQRLFNLKPSRLYPVLAILTPLKPLIQVLLQCKINHFSPAKRLKHQLVYRNAKVILIVTREYSKFYFTADFVRVLNRATNNKITPYYYKKCGAVGNNYIIFSYYRTELTAMFTVD